MKTLKAILFASSLILTSAFVFAAPVNVNTASVDEIAAALNGVGQKKAAAIVVYREQNGAFTTVEDLTKVKGIGDKLLEKNKADILLDNAAGN